MPTRIIGILNGKSRNVYQTLTVPRTEHVMKSWFRRIELIKIVKEVVDFEIVEREIAYMTKGVFLPLGLDELEMKPEGQRDWRWSNLWIDASMVLISDDKISIDGKRFRVSGTALFTEYGYSLYHIVEDYIGG